MAKEPDMKKALDNTIMYQYAHYSFEMEVYPDDDPEKLMMDVNSRNLNP